tara:strand:+ start:615 stop:1136 length:522 start_codon:yes stop_codon:yes gene_type:complete
MSYGDSIGNNNIAVSASMFQYSFVQQTGYNTAFGTTNRLPREWLTETGLGPAKINTNYTPSFNTGFSIPRNKDRLFWVNLERASSTTIASVAYTNPIASSVGTSRPGYINGGLSNNQNYLGITANVNYPYPFTAWRVNSSSGTTATTVRTTNIFFNSTYGGTNFQFISALYAI